MGATEPRWLTAEEQHSWRGFVLGTTLLLDVLDSELRAEFNLSLGEYEVLVRLSEHPDTELRMATLATSLRHSPSRITHTVKRMEKAGWVRRAEAHDDRRGVVCQLTPAGWELLKRAAPVHVDGVRRHLLDVTNPDDFAALGRVMNAVADPLSAMHPESDIR